MKILITGAAGMLGAAVIPELLRQKHEIIQTDINRRLPGIDFLDVTNPGDVLSKISDVRPDCVFHFAAETNVDLCERNPDHAFRVNTLTTENVAKACKESGAELLYISSGSVFNGKKATPYIESDVPKPVHVYGESKLRAETFVSKLLSQYFIIRAGWMVGGWGLDKKFVYKVIRQLKEGKKELMAVTDKFGSPTFTRDFAKNLMNVIDGKQYGLYHMANKGTCSRYDMAVKIVEHTGLTGKVKVIPVTSEMFPLPAQRPRSEMISNHKLELMGLDNMPSWEDSLKSYIEANKDA